MPVVRVPAALAVLDGDHELAARLRSGDVNGVSARSTRERHVAADELELPVRAQHAGQQARLAEDLEAVADPEHGPAARRRSARTASITGAKRAIAPQRR